MIYIDDKINEFMKRFYPNISLRPDKVILKTKKGTYPIPSKLYPLNNQRSINFFCFGNTVKIEDEKIKAIFDKIDLPIGRCYSNTMEIAKLFKEANIEGLETYVGWIIVDNIPIHHCWSVYKGIHLIDGGVDTSELEAYEFMSENNITDINEQRKILMEFQFKNEAKPNSERKTFGAVCPLYTYVGTVCTPEQGAEIYGNLIEKFPNHPSYSAEGQNPKGSSKFQEMVYAEKNKRQK